MLLRYLFVFLLSVSVSAYAQESESDLSLTQLLDKAFNYHPSIKSNKVLLSSAEKGLESAKWQYFPTPSVSVSRIDASKDDPSYPGDEKVVKLGFNQVLWAGGRIDAGLEKAQAQFNIRQFSVLIAKRELATKVIGSYSVWYSSYLKRKAFSASKTEHESLQKRIERRIGQGLSSGSDLSLVNSRLLQVSANLNSAITQHQSALLQLEELVGESLDEVLLVKAVVDDYAVSGDKAVLLKQALKIDPNLKNLLEKVKEANSTYKEVRSNLSPVLNLRFERQWGNHTTANADTENRVFLDLSSSFGAGLSVLSNMQSAKLEKHSILLDFETQKNTITQQFESDWIAYQSLSKQKKLLNDALVAAQKIQQSWYRQFLAGRKHWQDVMNSIREVAQLESQIADAIAESLLISWRLAVRIKGVNAI